MFPLDLHRPCRRRYRGEEYVPQPDPDPIQAAAGYNEGKQSVTFAGGALSVGFLKMSYQLIADRDRVAERLDRQPVLPRYEASRFFSPANGSNPTATALAPAAT